MSIVEVYELRKQYDPPKGVLAVDGVSFGIEKGEIFSLLGPDSDLVREYRGKLSAAINR